jgi:ribosomal protein S27AE
MLNVFCDIPDIDQLRLARLECPDCGGSAWFVGPRGGAATNLYCTSENCGSGFNVVFLPLGIWVHQRIGTFAEFRARMQMAAGGCSPEQPRSYKITDNGRAIEFQPCRVKSWNANDVTNRYCARCHTFMEDQR